MGLAADALETALVHVTQTLVDLLHLEPSDLARNEQLETCCALLLEHLWLCSRTLRDVLRADDRAKALLFYERARRGAARRLFFLEGLPSGLAILGASPMAMPVEHARELTFAQALDDRATTVSSLHKASNDRVERLRAAHAAADLPQLPGRVVVFVVRARLVARGLRHANGTRSFAPCANALCRRLFFVPRGVLSPAPPAGIDRVRGEDDCAWYWALARDEPQSLPDHTRFCSSACAAQHDRHRRRLEPRLSSAQRAADDSTKTTRSRIADCFRAAARRNALVAKAWVEEGAAHSAALEVTESKMLRRCHARALSVDLMLLSAAKTLAETPQLAGGRSLAGSERGWRADVSHAAALDAFGKLFDRHGASHVVCEHDELLRRASKIATKSAFSQREMHL